MTGAQSALELRVGAGLLVMAWVVAVLGWMAILPVSQQGIAMALTIGIETPILFAIIRPGRNAWGRTLLTGILINATSHPLVWTAIESRWVNWNAAELFAVGSEAVLIRLLLKVPWPLAIAASLIANAVTAYLGRVITLP